MNQEILNIKLNYKDVMFLLNVSEDDSKRMLRQLLSKQELEDCDGIINGRMDFFVHEMPWAFNSPDPNIHGKLKVYTIIDNMRQHGVPQSMKRRLYENEKCILSGRICGVFNTLNKVLTIKQRIEYGEDLKRIKVEFLAFNKPTRVTKYNLTECEQDKIDLISNKMFEDEV